MTEWLAIQLYGPLVSWGDIAVGEYRPSWDRPTRSAVLGLISAAIGLRHEQEEELAAVAKGYLLGYRIDADGAPSRDYHTSQVPSSGTGRNKKVYHTRREELLAPIKDISTILSSRDYRCDACATVFVTETVNAPYKLAELVKKLNEPVFVLYLGRRACPPALPLYPRIIEADTLADACVIIPPPPIVSNLVGKGYRSRIFWEEGILSGYSAIHTVVRRDDPVSHKRRQFTYRTEYMAVMAHNKEA